MSAPVEIGAGATEGAGDGFATAGAGVDALAGGMLAGGTLEGGALAEGVGVASTGTRVSSIRGSAGAPVLSVAAAVSVPDGLSTRVAEGSDELNTEHAARRGIIASTSNTRIVPPLTQPASTCATGTSRARLETSMQAEL
jgi:hypothetical protein